MNQILQGIIPALLTPFGKDGKVNTDALAQLIDWNIEKGVNGFYVGGSTRKTGVRIMIWLMFGLESWQDA